MARSFATFADVLSARARDPETAGHGFVLLGPDGREAAAISFAELDEAARKIALALQRKSQPGDRILLLFPSGIDFIKAFMGCLYAGRIAVPLFPPDLKNLEKTLPRFRRLVADARPTLAMAPSENLTLLRGASLLLSELRKVKWLSPAASLKEEAGDFRPQALSAGAVAFLQYTSGSTSNPKGVMVTNGNLVANSEIIYNLAQHSPSSVYVSWLPIYHDMGLIGGILQPIYMGGRGIIMSPFTFLRRPFRWLEAISSYRGTTSPFPNFALELCIKKVSEEEKSRLDLRSLRVACNGSEPIRADTLRRFSKAFAGCGFDARAHYPAYGLAESTLLVTGGKAFAGARELWVSRAALLENRVVEGQPGASDCVGLVGCGQASAGHPIAIVDPQTRRRCSADEVGEIWLAGPSVALGYWQNPGATEEHFRARLEGSPEQAFLRTGDLGFLKGKELFITGRIKDLIIIGGANYYPQDIEQAAEGAPEAGVRPGCAAAFSIPDEEQERLVVVVELKKTEEASFPGAIKQIRKAIVDEVGVVPHRVVLIPSGTIAKTSSGKLQRGLMRSRYLEGQQQVVHEG
jgi:acyl-CoA synthetase (AMP-forming)/AMP-acid ligase II